MSNPWRKSIALVFLMFMLTMVFTGCGDKQGDAQAGGEKDEDTITIGFSSSGLNHPFQITLKDGILKAAEKADVKVIVVDAQDDPAKQISNVEDLIQQEVDLIIINPTDSEALIPAVEKANKADIPVITVDRSVSGGEVSTHIASDNVEGAKMAAKYIAKRLDGKGNVVEIQGQPGASAARDRGRGLHEGLEEYADIKIVYSQPADWDRNKAMNTMQNALQSNPDIDAVFAHNDEMALGALRAIESAGLKGKIVVVGFDAIDEAVDAVKAGDMDATIAQQTELMGETSLNTALEILNGEQLPDFVPVELQVIEK